MFQMKAHAERRKSDRRITDSVEEERTIIGTGVHIMGGLQGKGDVEICGTLEGPCTVEGTLVIRDKGKVTGDVSAVDVVLAGELEGNLVAKGRVELNATCRMTGSIRAKQLIIVEGAYLKGGVQMEQASTRASHLPGDTTTSSDLD